MSEPLSPRSWANTLSKLLSAAYGSDRFPVQLQELACDYSRQRFANDPIDKVKGKPLPGFEGGLIKLPPSKGKGWGILYNSDISSSGRRNYTIGHEFGHYLLHRQKYPEGLQCSQDDLVRWDSEYGKIESEANIFAANLLMPFDDFRSQIGASDKPSLSDIGVCADRYSVSLMASTLRWLEYTERRSILVVSRDGFILWSRASKAALKTGMYYKTRGVSPVPVPSGSLAEFAPSRMLTEESVEHGPTVWFNQECEEIILVSDRYDFTMSLIHFASAETYEAWGEQEPEEDAFQKFTKFSK